MSTLTLVAYHNDQQIKSEILAQLARHRAADDLVQGHNANVKIRFEKACRNSALSDRVVWVLDARATHFRIRQALRHGEWSQKSSRRRIGASWARGSLA